MLVMRGIWFELDETGKLILLVTISIALSLCGIADLINRRK